MSRSMKMGGSKASLKVRKNDCNETPEEATRTLLAIEELRPVIWEPSCGPGAMVRVLREAGHQVIATDLVNYGCEDSQANIDFLMELAAPVDDCDIVMNPPYKLDTQFIRHALRLCPRVFALLRLGFLESDTVRNDLIDEHLARVWVGRERLPMMHRHGYTGPKLKQSGMPFAWFVFTREKTGGLIETRRMSWRVA